MSAPQIPIPVPGLSVPYTRLSVPYARLFVPGTQRLLMILIGLLLPLAAGAWMTSGVLEREEGMEWEVTGRVVSGDDRPVSGASVQLLVRGQIISSTPTDPDGYFALRISERRRVGLEGQELVLRVERMGYEPAEQVVAAPGDQGLIILAPRPIPLQGFEVEGVRPTCDGDDAEGEGRRLWKAAQAKHPGGLDTLGVASYTLVQVDSFQANSQGASGGQDGELAPGQRGSSPILRLGWERRIDRGGYAFPVRRTDRSGSFSSWSYAPLDSDLAPHFGLDSFGENHHFQLLPRASGEDAFHVRFCGRDEDVPHLEGRLEIGLDTLIRAAEWHIRTPEPHENAGGRAVFPPVSADGEAPFLLPMESEFWVTQRETRTIRRTQWFEGWVLAPGDSVPFLPRRADAGHVPPHL